MNRFVGHFLYTHYSGRASNEIQLPNPPFPGSHCPRGCAYGCNLLQLPHVPAGCSPATEDWSSMEQVSVTAP